MSKHRSTAKSRERMKRADESARKKLTAEPHPMPGFCRGQFDEVEASLDDPYLGLRDFPTPISDALLELSWDIGKCALSDERVFGDLSKDQQLQFTSWLNYAAEQGFAIALYRYAKHLRAVPELAAWNHTRHEGGDKGRKVQQTKKANRIASIQAMLNSGMEPAAIAADLKCSLATVYRALKPATSKPRTASTRSRKR